MFFLSLLKSLNFLTQSLKISSFKSLAQKTTEILDKTSVTPISRHPVVLTNIYKTHLFKESLGLVADEEASLDESLAVPHEIVAEESWINTISSPSSHTISHANHISVAFLRSRVVVDLASLSWTWPWTPIKVTTGPLVHVSGDEVSIVSDLTSDDVVDVVTASWLGEPTNCSH